MSTIIKLTSEKGKPMLGYEGFLYTLDRQTEAKMIFRCQNRDCKGRCHTNPIMDAIVSGPTEHCHAPNHDHIPVVELRNQIKSRSADSEEPSSAILHTAIRSFPLDSSGQLPKTETLLRTIRRQRQGEAPNPDNLLPDHLKVTDRGDNFVLHEDKTLIIFTTDSNLSVLKSCKHWFADGTFKVCPEDFYQMFTLHGLFKSQIIPLVYGLLIGKKTSDYDQFFKLVMDQGDFNPESILTDFER
jgi:FLYWCH zinc finger domain